MRSSQGTATSQHKFVGSLGHPSDDATGLIYMRARWMDPATGRFVSEDPAGSGTNWYVYADNNPPNGVDASGRNTLSWTAWFIGMAFAFAALAVMFLYGRNRAGHMPEAPPQLARLASAQLLAGAAIAWIGIAAIGLMSDLMWGYMTAGLIAAQATIAVMLRGGEAASRGIAGTAVAAAFIYGITVLAYALSIGAETSSTQDR